MPPVQSNVVNWASYYANHGLIIVKLPPQSKRPNTAGWQKKTTLDNPNTISNLNDQSNIGILLGSVSNNCVDVDLDCPAAINIAPYFLPQTATFGRYSAPSSHYVYRTSDSPDFITSKHTNIAYMEGTKKKIGGMIVELRASGGLQTVFPGSIHEGTGEVIEWTDFNGGDPLGLTHIMSSEALNRQVRKVAAMVIINEHVVSGVLHHASLYIIGALYGMGWSEEETSQFVDVMVNVCDMDYEGEIDRQKMIYEHYHTERHTEGGFGVLADNIDDLAATKLRDLLSTTAYNDRKVERADQVFDNVVDVPTANPTQNPTIDSTQAQQQPAGQNSTGPDSHINDPSLPPVLDGSVITNPNAPPPELLGDGSAVDPSYFGHLNGELFVDDIFIKSTDFIATAENPGRLDFLVDGFLVQGEVGLLVAPGSAKKTYLTLDLACSLAYKESWAGVPHPNNEPNHILYIAGEGKDIIKQRTTLWHQQNAEDVKTDSGDLFHYDRPFDMNPEAVSSHQTPRPKPGAGKDAWTAYNQQLEMEEQRDDIAELTGLLEQSKDYNKPIDLIVIDTLSSCYSGNENDSASVSAVIQRLKSLAETFNCTILMVHHTNKEGSTYRGSTAWKNNSDFYFEVKPEEKALLEGQVPSKNDKPEYTGCVVLTDPRQKKLPSNENAFVFKSRVEVVENYTNNKSSGDTKVYDMVLDIVDRKEEPKPKEDKESWYEKKPTEGIDSLIASQRDTFNYVAPLILAKAGAGMEGVHIRDLYDAVVSFRANNRQKSPGTFDNFGKKLDKLANAKVITITRKGGGEWVQLGEYRFITPGYKDTVSPVDPTLDHVQDKAEDVFDVIPNGYEVNTITGVLVNTNIYAFLD